MTHATIAPVRCRRSHRRGATALFLAFALTATCGKTSTRRTPEDDLRARLGVPSRAATVAVFAQTTHLDPGWQKTTDEYYRAFVDPILVEARKLLEAEPRAFFSLAEMTFLEHHLVVHPEELPALRSAAERGALRIVGGGMTSPDTLLPETELLLRDFLHGTRFAAETLGVRPRAAWLPDSFGHAATVPDILSAAGFSAVAFARIDGAPTLFERIIGRDDIRPGSDAETLRRLGSADFLWRGPGGAEIFAHYMSYNFYCTGDNIDYKEPLQIPGGHLGTYRGEDPDFTDARIDEYVAALRPYAQTPYLFVPVGCDFQYPKVELLAYLDGYNARRYPTTGVWAVAATFEEYVDLVLGHREALPTLEGDLTPYYMGFYGTRADLKRRSREAARPFFAAEPFAVAAGDEGRAAFAAATPALSLLTRSNHHDFIPGTSTDKVTATEQLPLLDQTEAAGTAELATVTAAIARRIPPNPDALGRIVAFNPAAVARDDVVEVDVPLTLQPGNRLEGRVGNRETAVDALGPGTVPSSTRILIALDGMPPFSWRAIDLFRSGGLPGDPQPEPRVALEILDANGRPAGGESVARIVLSNERVRAELTRASGFALTSLRIDGVEALAGPSFLLRDYADMGGLWRLGNEMPGCSFTPLTPPPDGGAAETVTVLTQSRLAAGVAIVGPNAKREVRLDAGASGLDLALVTGAAETTTRTAVFLFLVADGAPLRTSLAGGSAERVPERLYKPTFWPAVEWASTGDMAVLLRQSSGVRFEPDGTLEIMAARDARSEKCDIEGGRGSDPGLHRLEWRLERVAAPTSAARAALAWNRPVVVVRAPAGPSAALDLAVEQSLLDVSGDGLVTALKPADRGEGVILRALLLPGPVTVRLGAPLAGRRLVRVDAAERDIEDQGRADESIVLDRDHFGSIATVRLR